MGPLILIAIVLAIIALEYKALVRVWRPHVGTVVCRCFIVAVVLAVIGSYITTFHYEHMPNADTRFLGWPVPRVIFQRRAPDGPWLDFVGITMVLAFPMNLILFLLLPSIAVLPLTRMPRNSA